MRATICVSALLMLWCFPGSVPPANGGVHLWTFGLPRIRNSILWGNIESNLAGFSESNAARARSPMTRTAAEGRPSF
jgi:hypothetical protein